MQQQTPRYSSPSVSLSEKELDEGLLKVEKKLVKEVEKDSYMQKFSRRIVIYSIIIIVLLLFLLYGLTEYTLTIFPLDPDLERAFFVDTCYLGDGLKCSFDAKGTRASFSLYSEKLRLDGIDSPVCMNHSNPSNNTLKLENCQISPLSNSKVFFIQVTNPSSGLTYKIRGRIVKLLEYTRLRAFIKNLFHSK